MREETFLKVERVIADTGFVPKIAPNLMAGKGSKIIGAIVGERELDSEIINRCAAMIFLLEKELYKNGLYVILHSSDEAEEIIQFVQAWKLQGVFAFALNKKTKEKLNTEIEVPIIEIEVSHIPFEMEKRLAKQMCDFLKTEENDV